MPRGRARPRGAGPAAYGVILTWMVDCRDFVSLIRHLTTRSANLAAISGPVFVTLWGGHRSNNKSALKEMVLQCMGSHLVRHKIMLHVSTQRVLYMTLTASFCKQMKRMHSTIWKNQQTCWSQALSLREWEYTCCCGQASSALKHSRPSAVVPHREGGGPECQGDASEEQR